MARGDEIARNQLKSELPAGTSAWIDDRLGYLRRTGVVRREAEAEMGELPWLILMLAARGKAVIVGRGAGFLLPDETTLHVRVVAPEADRVGYMVQWLRLTRDDTGRVVRMHWATYRFTRAQETFDGYDFRAGA